MREARDPAQAGHAHVAVLASTGRRRRPSVRATLADLTCDSDGHLSRFVMGEAGDGLPTTAASPEPVEALLLQNLDRCVRRQHEQLR